MIIWRTVSDSSAVWGRKSKEKVWVLKSPGPAKKTDKYGLTATPAPIIEARPISDFSLTALAVKKAAVYLNNKLSEVKESSGLDEKRAAIITALNITNEYLKNLSDVSKDESINKSVDDLTYEIKEQIERLSFKA